MDWNLDHHRRLIERHLTPTQISDLREVLLKTTAQHQANDPMLLIVAIILLNSSAFTSAVDRFTSQASRSEAALDPKKIAQETVVLISLGLKSEQRALEESAARARAAEASLEQRADDYSRQFERHCSSIVDQLLWQARQQHLPIVIWTALISVCLTVGTFCVYTLLNRP